DGSMDGHIGNPAHQQPDSANDRGQLDREDVHYYDSYGLPTEVDEYTWGPTLARKTLVAYNRSLSNNIVDRPSSVQVQDAGGNLVAQTTYSYDQTAAVTTSGTPQHVSVSGSRGNTTTVTNATAITPPSTVTAS